MQIGQREARITRPCFSLAYSEEGAFRRKGEAMNIRKNVDYSPMFDAMRVAMSSDIPQMNLYYELGRLICQRTEKGAAVAAAEYLQQNYPNVPGLSPRNLRRMRAFYSMYEGNPELLDLAMEIGWTQNVVILEADLNTAERRWYLCAVKQFGWTKADLQQKIESQAHQEVYLDVVDNRCYTECESTGNGSSSEELRSGGKVYHGMGRHKHRRNQQCWLTFCLTEVIRAWYRLHQQTGPPALGLTCMQQANVW